MTAITAHSRQKRNRQKSVALFHCLPHTVRNAAGRPARQRKSAACIEKLRIIETNQIEPACVHGIIDSAKRNCGFDKSE